MAHSICQDVHGILPPQVKGKLFGHLNVSLDEISFHGESLRNVSIFISWWGEKDPSLLRSPKISSTKSVIKSRASYEIRTSFLQFERYLKDCECLKIKIVDEDIPENVGWVTLLDLWFMLNYCPYKSYFPIVNSHGQNVGELNIEFNVRFLENEIPKMLKNHDGKERLSKGEVSMSKRNSNSQDCTHHRNSVKIGGDLMPTYPNTFSLRNAIKNNSSSERYVDSGFGTLSNDRGTRSTNDLQKESHRQDNMMDYILGKNMSPTEEKNAVNYLKDWPALESVLEAISDNSEYAKNSDTVMPENKSGEIISLKHQTGKGDNKYLLPFMGFHVYLKIISLELTYLDASKTYKSSFSICPSSGATYFIEYRFPISTENESKMRPWREPLQGVRMSSKKQVGSVVFFNQSSIHHLSTKHQVMQEQLATNLKFRIQSRQLNQRMPSLIGEVQVLLGDLLPKNVQDSDLRKFPILTSHSHNKICKGMLVLRVKWVNIAKTLVCDTEDVTQKPSDDFYLKSSQQKTDIKNQSVKYGYDTENGLISSIKAPLLHMLISVPEAYYCLVNTNSLNFDKKISFNMYLVCRAFWNKGIVSRSQVFWSTNNPKFEFSEVEPLLLTQNFVDMCQNNFMVIEIWDKQTKNGEDTLLGISKVSLHQFYIAYKDPTMFDQVMKLKYPVISMDGNVRVFDSMDPSKICGWLRVLLALGTQEQVYLLRKSHVSSLYSGPEITENTRKHTSYNSLLGAGMSNDKIEPKKHKLELVLTPLDKFLQIDRLTGFAPLSKTSFLENSDCYVEFRLPFPNDQELIKSSVKPVSSVVKFFSPPVYLKCPANITEEITFNVWCRCYDSNAPPRDRMVARAKIPLRRLFFRENNCLDKAWTQNFSLPLVSIEYPTKSDSHSSGFLVIKVFDKVKTTEKNMVENDSLKSIKDQVITSHMENDSLKSTEDQVITSHMENDSNKKSQTDSSFDDAIKQRPVVENDKIQTIYESNHENHSNPIENVTEKNELLVDHSIMSTKEQERLQLSDNQESSIGSYSISDKLNQGFHESSVPDRFDKISVTDLFKVHMEIDRAVHLKSESPICGAYVTFWSYNNIQLWVTSNVHSGNNPKWSWHCDTYLSRELLTKNSKKLVLQVWTTRDLSEEPNPSKDISLGLAGIDLNVLVYGMPQISGWFNIFSSDQHCIGQIKVTVTPMEDLSKFRHTATKSWLTGTLKHNNPCNSSLIEQIGQQSCSELPREATGFQKLNPSFAEFESKDKVAISLEDEMIEQPHSSSGKEEQRDYSEVASLTLKSKIDELDGMLKKLRETFGIKEDQHSLYDTLADADITKLYPSNTYVKSVESVNSSAGTPASISSNSSRKFSSVNPSTELKILEKYVSDLVKGMDTQSVNNSICISPGLEELFYQFGINGIESREEVCQNDQNRQHFDFSMPMDLGEVEVQYSNQEVVGAVDAIIREVNESCTAKKIPSSSNSSSSMNERDDNSNCDSEGKLKEDTQEVQTVAWVKGLEDFITEDETDVPLEVTDLPRQAPEGGNPNEDEKIQAQLTQTQNISPKTNQTQNNCSTNDATVPVHDRSYEEKEIQRIAKIFNTTFTKT